ncbi:MAG: S8 family serine peptidase, partial [Pyrinomonadaceae bacterium]|nr:S8 family serine peptidase [Pyrinomonadaceae bacterium]
MTTFKLVSNIYRLIALSLIFTLGIGILISDRARAQHSYNTGSRSAKVAPDLHSGKISARDNDDEGGADDDNRVSVIIQLSGEPSNELINLLKKDGVRVKKLFKKLPMAVVDVPEDLVEILAAFDEVAFISPDKKTESLGHISQTTGSDAVRSQTTTTTTTRTTTYGTSTSTVTTTWTLDGRGVGIAVLDSGIYATHKSFVDPSTGKSRVTYSRDFTGENRTDDPYGHGTHVASIAAGTSSILYGAYTGVAPKADIINLRVLGADGTGRSSSVLDAIEWVLSNHAAYKIRVVNMSLGTS